LLGVWSVGCNHTFGASTKTKECKLSIPSKALTSQVVGIGNCSGSVVNKYNFFVPEVVKAWVDPAEESSYTASSVHRGDCSEWGKDQPPSKRA
jgi:hypothetical protein